MNVLVTGGAGYIGSHTCKLLSQKGHKPVSLDNLSTGNKWAVKWGPFYQANIQDTEKVKDIINKEKIDAIIHFAANAYVGESMQNPLKYFENNIANTTQFLKAVLETNVRKIVFSSTCATYGVPPSSPISESTEQKPINPYGYTKYSIEQLLKYLQASSGLNSISLRYFNAAGADSEAEIGELHDPETHLIPLAIQAAIDDTEMKVFGDDYPTADGSCVRDYIHVEDLAMAHLQALEKLNSVAGAFACNLGTEKGTSVFEMAAAIEKQSGKKLKMKIEKRRAGDPPELVASAQLAKEFLGWKAQHNLESIVKTAWNWQVKIQKEKPQ